MRIFTNIHEPSANSCFSITTQVKIEIPKWRSVKFYHNRCLSRFLIDQFAIFDKSPTTLLTSRCRAMPFSARALRKNKQFFDVDIVVKNKWKCVLSWSVLLSTTSTRHYSFPKQLFSRCLCLLSEFAKVFERKVWRVQVAHLHSAARAPLSFRAKFSLEFKWFLSYIYDHFHMACLLFLGMAFSFNKLISSSGTNQPIRLLETLCSALKLY